MFYFQENSLTIENKNKDIVIFVFIVILKRLRFYKKSLSLEPQLHPSPLCNKQSKE